jgi:hypothetical protein
MLKPIITQHKNPLLENFESLNVQDRPSDYAGFIYLWKCIPEDKFYLGSHKGLVHDEYRGSGSTFKKVFEHYGITQFKRVVLEYVENEDNLKAQEQKWMNKFRAVKSSRFYNNKNAVSNLAV